MNPIYMATKHETFLYDTHKVEQKRNEHIQGISTVF